MEFKNEFFNSDECEFEVLGFAEYLMDTEFNKFLGERPLPFPDRPLGSKGIIHFEITKPITLSKGHKTVTYKASKEKPIKASGMLIVLSGRTKAAILRERSGGDEDWYKLSREKTK